MRAMYIRQGSRWPTATPIIYVHFSPDPKVKLPIISLSWKCVVVISCQHGND
jgi:hypothetical protein